MRWNRCLLALALLVFLPARADTKPADAKKEMSCCAGEEGADKALCPKAKTKRNARAKATDAASKKQAAAKAPPVPGAANMVVTKDPETGELRPATAAEREKLLGRRPLATPEHKVVTLPDGSVMVELGEADMSYAVATRNPDGTITKTCVHGDAAAAKAAASPAPTSASAKPADR